MVEVQRLDIALVRDLAEQGRQPQTAWVEQGELDVLQHRLDWIVAHRSLFE